jgi:tape measure domain-containing protein
MDIATLGIRVDATEARLAAIELEKLSAAGGKTAKAMSSVEKSMQGLTGLFAGLGLGALAKSVLDTNREMESLRASLKSVMGSAQGAQGAFNAILTFAKDTPYEIKGLTQTFIMLQNMGIKPTHQVMQSLTDQASKLGGSQETLTSIALQLGQAHSKGKLQMEDMVVLMQRGVHVMKLLGEVTGKNAAELSDMSAKGTITVDMIDKLIVKMGEAAAGSNANAMETLNGKISSLSDAWHSFEDALLNDKSEGYLKTVVSNWTAWLDYFKDSIAGVGKEFLALEEINNKIVSSKAKISAMSQGGISGAAWQVAGALTGNSIEGEKNRLSDFIKQREGVIKTTHDVIVAKNQETAATDKLLNSTNQEKKVLEETLQSKKEHDKAAKEAARAEASLAKSFEDTLKALSLNNVEQSQTKRQLEEATLASKGYNKAMIEQAMVLWDAGAALAAKKQLNEEEKSQLDSLIDRYNKATMSARDYYSSTLNTTSPDGIKSPMSGADKAPLLSQFDKTSKAELDKKVIDDAKTSLDAYNSSLDSANSKTSDLSAVTSAIFDGALAGINGMAGAFDSMVNSIDSATQSLAKNSEAQTLNNAQADSPEKTANATKYAQVELDLNDKVLNAKLKAGSQIAGFLSSSLKKGSTEQKAAHAIQMALAGAELAMNIMKVLGIGTVAAAETASVLPSVAASTAKGTAKAAEAVATQATAGPFIGFALMAAMAAAMAAIGFFTGGGSSSSSGGTPPPSDTGTGTVLGDQTAVSESIGKTNDLLKTIHASEYVELRGINRGVNNLQQGISNTVSSIFRNGGLTSVTLAPSSISGIASLAFNPIQKFIGNFLFGGKVTQSVVGQGMGTNATSLQSVIDGGNVSGYQYADIKTHTSGGLFRKAKTKYSTQYSAIGEDTQKAFNDIFSSVGDTIVSIAGTLGKSIETDLMPRVISAVIPAMRVNLMGLSGEDAAKKLNGVISAMMDTMTTQIFGDIVGKYQKLGEGMLETTVRIVSEIVIVKDALNQSGLKLLAKDIVAVSDAIVQAAGGLEAFQQQFESFFDKFYSDAEKQTRLQKTLVGSLAEANVILPTTRENYKKLVEGLNMTNPLDQQRYSLLLELSAAADTYYSMLESGAADAAKIAKTQRSLDIQYMELTGDAVGALTEKRKDELAAMDASLRITQKGVYILTDANKAVADATTAANKAVTDAMALASKAVSAAVNDVSKAISNLSSLAQKLRGALTGNTISTDATTRKDRTDAQAVLKAALKVANAGGSIDNFAGMDKALTDISKPSEQLYATFTDYARDQALTSGTITQLADYADAQVSMAQKQIDAINNTTNAVNSVVGSLANLTEAQKTLATVEDQKAQIDKMLSNNMAVLSVGEAVTNLALALNAQNEATQKIAVAQAAAKAEAAAELKMNDVKKKAEGSSQNLADANAEKKRMEDALYNANLNIEYIAVRAEVTRLTAAYQASPSAARSKAVNDYLISVGSKFNEKYNPNPNVAADKMWTLSPNYRGDGSYSLPGAGTQTIAEANATALSISSLANAIDALIPSLSAISSTDTLAASEAYKEFIIAKEKAAKAAADLPAFASGGQHEGGWRIVGENGPELEKTGASRIFSNPQSKSLLNMDELIAEIKSLRSDVRAGQQAIANNTLRTAKILRDVTQDGTAITTVVAA